MSLTPSGYMMTALEEQMFQLIIDLVDPGQCWFDHHGGCQEHGYYDLKPGEKCPHQETKELLKEYGFEDISS